MQIYNTSYPVYILQIYINPCLKDMVTWAVKKNVSKEYALIVRAIVVFSATFNIISVISYRRSQFDRWRKLEKTTDLQQVTDKL